MLVEEKKERLLVILLRNLFLIPESNKVLKENTTFMLYFSSYSLSLYYYKIVNEPEIKNIKGGCGLRKHEPFRKNDLNIKWQASGSI